MSDQEFQPGDVVQLKSGGEKWVVDVVNKRGDCYLIRDSADGRLIESDIPTHVLRKAEGRMAVTEDAYVARREMARILEQLRALVAETYDASLPTPEAAADHSRMVATDKILGDMERLLDQNRDAGDALPEWLQ